MSHEAERPPEESGVDLYWIPLGAGAHVVRLSGRAFEAVSAAVGRRARRDLYHSALVVHRPDASWVVEVAPVPDAGGDRGVVGVGAVGSSLLGRVRVFRYEVRCWPEGSIPDLAAAVDSPVRALDGLDRADRVLGLVQEVPTPVWGRRRPCTTEMWNSNSVTSWVLTRAGADIGHLRPPAGGRAPGWAAGIEVARRQG